MGPYIGRMATPKQGKDLEIACKMINEGAHMRDVALANPVVYIMFNKGLEKYRAILRKQVWRPGVLGEYQLEWLFKFNTIDLVKWRVMSFDHGKTSEWLYVGDWKPTEINMMMCSKIGVNDGGYGQRRINLEKDRYYYWDGDFDQLQKCPRLRSLINPLTEGE